MSKDSMDTVVEKDFTDEHSFEELEFRQSAIDYYYEWEGKVVNTNVGVGDEVLILSGPYQDKIGVALSDKAKDDKYPIALRDGVIGHFYETEFKITNTDYKVPSSIRMTKAVEGSYINVPFKDFMLILDIYSRRKAGVMDANAMAEVMQRWNIAAKDRARNAAG